MNMFSKNTLRILLCAAPLALAGCGEGWEMVRTDSYVPYGNTRTAGTGVAYVRAKLLPEKDLKLMPVNRRYAPAMIERVFEKTQRK